VPAGREDEASVKVDGLFDAAETVTVTVVVVDWEPESETETPKE
jgi:hypothetical protein